MMTEPQLQMCLGEALYNLIKIAPHNPVVKGLILQKIMKPVPDDVAPEAIMSWLFENATVPVIKIPEKPKNSRSYSFDVSYNETEYGRCRYSQNNTYSGNFDVCHEDMLNILEDSDEDLDTFVEKLDEFIRDNAPGSGYVSLQSEGDLEYEDHDVNDSEIDDWDISIGNIAEEFFNEHVESNAEDMPF